MSTIARFAWAAAYLSLMCALVGSLFYLRARTGELQNQDEWDTWREAEVHDLKTNVLRKRPKSQLPPMTALLQEHFNTCLAGAVIFGTALFVTFGFMLRGVWAGAPTSIHEDDQDAERDDQGGGTIPGAERSAEASMNPDGT